MTFNLDLQVISKLDDTLLENLLSIENKENHSCKTPFTECSKEFLELVGDVATARYKIMEKYTELVNAIKSYEEITDNFSKKISDSQTKTVYLTKYDTEYNSYPSKSVKDDNKNVENSTPKEGVEDSSSHQNLQNLEHFEVYTPTENDEYILNPLSIAKSPELNFDY